MRAVSILAIVVAGLAVSACGGGSGGVNSTPPPPPAPMPPPPPPPTPPNTSLLTLTSSESFTNDGATGSVSFPKTGEIPTISASQTAATIAYDLASKGYTITVGSRSLAFLPSDLDETQSNAGVVVYVKTNGTRTDTLTLTKPGTSGRFTYQYVGAGFWQRTTDNATTISGSFDAFSYGIKTPDAAVPRIGRAEYAIDVVGVQTAPDDVLAFTGTGNTQVDFANGDITMSGSLTGTRFGTAAFAGEAAISSSANSFSGGFAILDGGSTFFIGPMDGRFYGPAAQEIGAAFSVESDSGDVAVGTVIGRGGPVNASTPPFSAASVNSDSAKLKVNFNAATGTFTTPSSAQAPLIVQYDTAANSYTLVAVDRSQTFGPSRIAEFALVRDELSEQNSTGLTYVQSQKWTQTLERGDADPYDINYFAFGAFTPAASVPRTGDAGYGVNLTGTAADADYGTFIDFGGRGTLFANFATGAITTSGRTNFQIPGGAALSGAFTGTATISSSASSFAGNLALDGFGNYTGTLAGHFYGPAAEEVGAAFNLTDGGSGVAAGVITGITDPSLTTARSGLLDLTAPTLFASKYLFGATGQGFQSRTGSTLAFDPVTKTYTFTTSTADEPGGSPFVFGPRQIDSTNTTPKQTAYSITSPGIQFVARILDPGPANPAIALTYTSYADIIVREGPVRITHHYYPFGIRTPGSQIPISGSGTYQGRVFGEGVNFASGIRRDFDLSGTSTLDVNFGNMTFASALTINGKDSVTSLVEAFPVFNSIGEIFRNPANNGAFSDNGFFGFFSNASGQLDGNFYGAGAAEFGATFSLDYRLPDNTTLTLNGVTLGKRAP